jgi:hypothetical protein
MYLGSKTETAPAYTTRYLVGVGNVGRQYVGETVRTLESYQCETCGHVHNVLGRADEPFFCKCGRLVGIAPQ